MNAIRSQSEAKPLRAPFPYFGGKSRVAHIVWERFGNVRNYVEPFAGSLAVLLGRPHDPNIETVNDLDGFISNFWRALKYAPDKVAEYADWPVNENDLHARHYWLVKQQPDLTERLEGDPDYYDPKIAGWWVWGVCAWIGSGWCSGKGPWHSVDGKLVKGNNGTGINRKLPHLSNNGTGAYILDEFNALATRLRDVRVCCGDWQRVMNHAACAERYVVTGIFLDPPYSHSEHNGIDYGAADCAVDVCRWAIEHGGNPLLRIALCGYEGEHVMPETWECVAWKANGGYGSQGNGRGKENCKRERIWFSSACLRVEPAQTEIAL